VPPDFLWFIYETLGTLTGRPILHRVRWLAM
jgi:hypothetical protein